jgi:glycosyltransferase involved in cell wall biosynthesis
MRVLCISAAFPPFRAGESDHALHLCRNLAAAGLDVHVLTTTCNVSEQPTFKVHSLMPDWTWKDLPRLRRFLKECSPEALILMYSSWIYHDHPMITFAPTITKKLLPEVSFVTQFELDLGLNLGQASLTSRAIRKCFKTWVGASDVDWEFGTLLRDSDTVIALSDNYRKRFVELLPRVEEKSLLLPPPPLIRLSQARNGETRRRGRANLGVATNEFLLAYFGYVQSGKGIDVLLKALEKVLKRRENVRLVIIGGTEDDYTAHDSCARQMSKLAESLSLRDRVIWTGTYPPDSDYPSVCLRSADACVLPYDRGVTLNRSSFAAAVAHGLPTITTRGETIESPILDGEKVLLCPPKDPEALAGAIDDLIGSPETQSRLRDGALELAREWFSWEKAIQLTIEALEARPKTYQHST